LSSNPEKSDEHEHRGGRNYVPSDPDLHHAKGRDPIARLQCDRSRGHTRQRCACGGVLMWVGRLEILPVFLLLRQLWRQ